MWGVFEHRDGEGDLVRIDIAPVGREGFTAHITGAKTIDGCFCRPVMSSVEKQTATYTHNDVPRSIGGW